MAQVRRISKREPQDPYINRTPGKVATDSMPDFGGRHDLDIAQTGSCMFDRGVDYPYLSRLCRDGLIKAGVETTADAMTSEWIKLKATGTDESGQKADNRRLTEIEQYFTDNKVQDLFNQAARNIGYFGGCLIYIDDGTPEGDLKNLARPLVKTKGFIKGLKVIEPNFAVASGYTMLNPLSENFYRPLHWLLQGHVKVHRSRFLYFTSGETPALIRQKYNFFGIPIAEAVLNYVASFQETREAAARLLLKTSRLVFKTDMQDVLVNADSTQSLEQRIAYAATFWDNEGIFVLDNDREDFTNVQVQLGGVTDITRQALEMVAAIFRMTIVKLLGITPSGLNATGEADERNWQEHIGNQQERQLNAPLERLIDLVQVHLYGAADKSITFEWCPLGEVDARTEAETNAIITQTIDMAKNGGEISPLEARKSLQKNVTLFADINPEDVPPQPELSGYDPLGSSYASAPEPGPELLEQTPEEAEADLTPQETSLNGAQVTSMVGIVEKVAQGLIPRESGLALIMASFPVSQERALAILSNAGNGFVPAVAAEEPMQTAPEAPEEQTPLDAPETALETVEQTPA